MTCDCAFDQLLTALKGAFCMPEFSTPLGGSFAFGSTVDTSTTNAASCTTGAVGNVKGAWAELISATPHHATWIMLTLGGGGGDYLADIGIGGNGSEVVLIPDIHIRDRSFNDYASQFVFPVLVPAGSRISVRASDGSGSSVALQAKATLIAPSAMCPVGSGCVDGYGAITDGRGLNVDPGGTENTKSAWVEISSATSRTHNWLVLSAVCGDFSSSGQRWLIDLAVGGSGSEQMLIPDLLAGSGNQTDMVQAIFHLPLCIPQGSRIAIRAQCSSNVDADRDLYVRLFGC